MASTKMAATPTTIAPTSRSAPTQASRSIQDFQSKTNGTETATRTARTIAAALAFVAAGHTLTVGAFRLHITRLVEFLKSRIVAADMEMLLIERAIDAASTGKVPPRPAASTCV